jgi:hypothetical protein
MQKDHSFWPEWAHFLHRTGLSDVTAELLEAAGPVNLVLAQFVYMGQPVLQQMFDPQRIEALVGLFEDQDESRSFAAFLREESSG